MDRLGPRLILLMAALLTVCLAAGYGWLTSTLPRLDGKLEISGPRSAIEIARTKHGVPTVKADSFEDAWFGLGYVHAQDRLWQLEATRRFALGRLSELAGSYLIDTDANRRQFRLEKLAKQQYRIVTDDTRAALDAYAKGVNAFIDNADGTWPLEFSVLDAVPMRWEPWHGLLWGRQMALQLSGNMRRDLDRQYLFDRYGADRYRDLWPDEPLPVQRDAGTRAGSRFSSDVVDNAPLGASNAWAVAPSRSRSGGALLAGDPHLGFQLPNTWYLVRLEVGDKWLEGATAPGTPFVILGRTKTLAWTFTSNEADLVDVVTVDYGDILESRRESIAAKGGAGRTFRFTDTRFGPVVSGEILEEAPHRLRSGATGRAFHSPALLADDVTPDAFLRLNHAKNIYDAMAALKDFGAPLMNVLLADADGQIAQMIAGRLPVRERHHGRHPTAASAESWTETINASSIPVARENAEGYLANANEKPDALIQSNAHTYGDWADGARRARIDELMSANEKVDKLEMSAMQMDAVDSTWLTWRAKLAEMRFEQPHFQDVQKLMLQWDGHMHWDSPEPFVFAAWMGAIEDLLMHDERKRGAGKGLRAPAPLRFLDWIESDSAWCENVITKANVCEVALHRGFTIAAAAAARRMGDDIAKWRWGKFHTATFKNLVLEHVPLFGDRFNLAIETPGGDRTLNRGAHRSGLEGWNGFPHVHGAMFRAVHDMAPGEKSIYSLALGQSGNPFSRHYRDQLQRWRDGAYIEIDGPSVSTLSLVPAK